MLPESAAAAPNDMGGNSPLEGMARVLTSSGDYRVLRRFRPQTHYASPTPAADIRSGLIVDVETTGRDPQADRIIEIACLPFTFDRALGVVLTVGEPVSFLEDPGTPIPDPVVELTGITDAMVSGKCIDEGAVNALLAASRIVIAHNARFDRPFVERRIPAAARLAWACSMSEVPWKECGNPSPALGALLITHAGEFVADEGAQAHRAAMDCAMTLHVLATPLRDGTLPFTRLLESARRKSTRIWAVGAPIERKDLLKARGYGFDPAHPTYRKCWWVELPSDRVKAECDWLEEHMYDGQACGYQTEAVTAFERYAARG